MGAVAAFVACTDTPAEQDPEVKDYLYLERDTLYVGYEGVEQRVYTVDAPTVDWAFEVVQGAEWLTVKSSVTDESVKNLTISVAPNNGDSERMAVVSIRYKTLSAEFKVIQFADNAQPATRIVPDKNLYRVGEALGTLQIPVVADGEYSVSVPDSITWLQYNTAKTVEGVAVEEFYYDANFAEAPRNCTVSFCSGEVVAPVDVMQWGKADVLMSTRSLHATFIKNNLSLKVVAKNAYTVKSDAEWVKTSVHALPTCDSIAVSVEANNVKEQREATISFVCGGKTYNVEVVQEAVREFDDLDELDMPVDIPATITAVVATSKQSSLRDASRAIDGSSSTWWANLYTSDNDPSITFTVDASKLKQIDYLRYIPVSTSSASQNWGQWGQVEIYITRNGQAEELYTRHDFKQSESSYDLYFDKPIPVDVTKIRVRVLSSKPYAAAATGDYIFASAAEVGFYQQAEAGIDPLTIFKDLSCSELRDDVTAAKIESIGNKFYKELAQQLYFGAYDGEFRICKFHARINPTVDADLFHTNSYTLIDNVTGMYVAEAGDTVKVMLDDDHGLSIYVRVINWVDYESIAATSGHTYDYQIHKGSNVFVSKYRGLMYIMAHTPDYASIPEMTAHFVSGHVNGYIELGKTDMSRAYELLAKGGKTEPHFDMLSKKCILNFSKASIYAYTFGGNASNNIRVEQLLNIYDSVYMIQERIQGHDKYKALGRQRGHRNRALFRTTYGTLYGASSAYNTYYNYKSMVPDILSPLHLWQKDATTLNNDIVGTIWGIAHELGHSNQTNAFKWRGLTEVTNNLMCAATQVQFYGEGNTTMRFSDHFNRGMRDIVTRWVTDRDGTERRMTHCESCNSPSVGKISGGVDPTTQLEPFWQLYLYYHRALGRTDFYPDFYELCRNIPSVYNNTDADQSRNTIDYIKMVSDAAGEDLSDFCDAWGLPGVNNKMKVTHYGTNYITTTKADVDAALAYCHKYPKPKLNPLYINDLNVDMYRNPKPVVAGSHTVDATGHYTTSGWQNVVAWMLVNPDNGRVMAIIQNDPSFTYSYSPSVYMNNTTGTDYAYTTESSYATSDTGTMRALKEVTPIYRTDLLLYGVAADGTKTASTTNK